VKSKTDKEAPKREKLLRDNADPSGITSSTERDAPKRDIPNNDRVDPKRDMLLRAIEDPR